MSAAAAAKLRAFELTEQRENGGDLYGVFLNGTYVVADATVAAANRTRSSMALDGAERERVTKLHAARTGLEWLGSWHSHPNRGDARPSRTDLRCWLNHFDHAGIGRPVLGVIVARQANGGWDKARATAFIIGRENGAPEVAIAPVEMPGRHAIPFESERAVTLVSSEADDPAYGWCVKAVGIRQPNGRYEHAAWSYRRTRDGSREYRDVRPPGFDPSSFVAA
jgi:hypothetical protein